MGDIAALLVPYAVAFGLVLARVAALVGTAPIFSSMVVTNHVKIGLVATFTIALMFAAPYRLEATGESVLRWKCLQEAGYQVWGEPRASCCARFDW